MIDRKAYWISGVLVVAMLTATIWRIALLPDWTQIPSFGSGRIAVLLLFCAPLCVIYVVGQLAFTGWISKGSKDVKQSWMRWGSSSLIAYSLICTALQFVVLARSLGMAKTLNPETIVRTVFVLVGALLVVMGNQIPKLPWLEARIGILRLDSTQGAKCLRFGGWVVVVMGIGVAIGGSLLPLQLITLFFLSLFLGGLATTILLRTQLKRKQIH
jgi:hypothetical protein